MISPPPGKWYPPTMRGTRPPPIAQFSFTKIDDLHAALFGGYVGTGFSNEVYTLDLIKMVCNVGWLMYFNLALPWLLFILVDIIKQM